MDSYIRNFTLNSVETVTTDDVAHCNTLFKNNQLDFTVIHQNIRSLSRNLDEFKLLLHQINREIHCIVLSETWHIEDASLYNIQGYDLVYNNGRINQNDGLVIYVRCNLAYDYKVIDMGIFNAVQVTVSYFNKRLLLTGVYRLPSTDPREFNLYLSNYLKDCTSNHNYDLHIFTGDININILSNDEIADTYQNILGEVGFISTINKVTRKTEPPGSCIDHIFLHEKRNVLDKYIPIVLETNITDHFSVLLHMRFSEKSKITNTKTKRCLNTRKLLTELEAEDWSDVYSNICVNTATEIFVSKVSNYISNNHNLIKTRYLKKTQWITNGLIKSIQTKNALYRLMKTNPTDENKTRCRKYRNCLNLLIKVTKREYYQQQICANRNNSAGLWGCVKQICHDNKKHEIKKIRTDEGTFVTTRDGITNTFINFFTNIGEQLAHKINSCHRGQNTPKQKNKIKLDVLLSNS